MQAVWKSECEFAPPEYREGLSTAGNARLLLAYGITDQIPIRTELRNASKPGPTGADTVSYSGPCASEIFARTFFHQERRRSEIHTLMMDCRVTPKRAASLSREWIIHAGKSTFTRRGSSFVLLARAMSRNSKTLFPASKRASNSLAFIKFSLLTAGASDGNNADASAAPGDNRRPVFSTHLPYYQGPRFILALKRNLQQLRIIPERLSLHEIKSMLFFVYLTLLLIKFKIH